MLPPELFDQITSLNTQHRELLSIIYKLSQSSKITSQLDLDDLVAQIKAKFAEADQDIETLQLEININQDLKIKAEAEIYAAKIVEDFKLARASFRKLLLQAIKTLKEARHTQASKHLFVPIQPVAPQARISTDSKPRHDISPTSATQDTIALTAATDVTLTLKRTHQLLEQELEKSTISLETLDHSSQTLRQLEQQYSAFDVLLKGSKRLITELERADYWDRWLIYISLTIFGLTCLWITYKRILRGPLGLMIWVGRKAFSASGSGQPVSLTKAVSVTKSLTSSITQEAIETVSTALLSSRDEL